MVKTVLMDEKNGLIRVLAENGEAMCNFTINYNCPSGRVAVDGEEAFVKHVKLLGISNWKPIRSAILNFQEVLYETNGLYE